MATRTFRNDGDVAIQFPTLGLEIRPGDTADIDIADQPCPDGLTEVTAGTGGAKRSPTASAARQQPAPSSPQVTEPAAPSVTEPGPDNAVKES